MANQFLSLSLFIMLLSFFIILNAVSNFDDAKSKPVLNSLAITFSNNDAEPDLKPNIIESTVVASTNEGSTLDKIQGLFQTQISDVKVHQNRLGTEMFMRMPIKKFERAVTGPVFSSTLPGRQNFLSTLISLIEAKEGEQPYRMDITIPLPITTNVDDEEKSLKMSAEQRRVASFARDLERAGLDKKLVSAGIANGQDGFVDLHFQRYEAFDPTQGDAP